MGKIVKFVIILVVTILLITNPGTKQYENYASRKLTTYLKQDVCNSIAEKTGSTISKPCSILIDTARPQIKTTISKNTNRQNFFLFSLYQTDLSFPPIVPEYHFATVGIFERFFTYQTEINE